MAEKKKPLSLNDRNNRMIDDLSVSHPSKPPPPPAPAAAQGDEKPSKAKLEGRRRLFKASSGVDNRSDGADDVSQFSDIADFDSPLELESEMQVKVRLEGRRRLCKISSSEMAADDDNVGAGKKCGTTDQPNFSILSDFDSPASEKNPTTSSKNGGAGKKSGPDEPKCSILSEFDSPVSEKKLVTRNNNGGGNDIRDILNELSSKFDFLSIEKKRIPKTVNLVGDSVAAVDNNEVKKHEKIAEFPEYESASSSFSHTSERSDSPSDVTNQPRAIADVEYIEDDVPSVCESNNVFSEVRKSKNVDIKQENNDNRRITVKSGFGGKSVVSNVVVDDDDCVVLSSKILSKKVERRSQFVEVCDVTDGLDEIDDSADDIERKDDGSITLSGPKFMFKLHGKIAKMLYPHQRDGLRWLWSLHCQGKGGILGDDMGLGKTMQMCGYLAGLFDSRLIKRALIVSPKTLIPHWIKELAAVGLSEKTREYFGTSAKTRQSELQYILQDKGVLLTTYDIVRNNSKALRGDYYFKDERSEDNIAWDYMILDEGHLIKNPSTQRAKSLLEITSAHRIIISGTPIQNNLKELWALFNFCCPELLGDKTWFKERYESPILRGNDKNASDREKRIGSTVAKELRERIQPYFLRRLKSEVFREDDDTNTAKLSKKNEMIVWLRLTSCQQQLYEAFLNSELVLSAFDGSPLAALTILKKICDHPLLLTKRAAEDLLDGMDSMLNQEDHGVAEKLAMHLADLTEIDDFQEKHDNISCKIYFILALLDNLIPQGHNVLIFSQTRKMLNLIQESLGTKGYKYLRIDGTTKASDRLKIVNDFQEGVGAPIFLLTSQVGGLGLTLTKADRVIVVDPAWNPSTDNQSVDRAYRIGQTKDVIVYRLMTSGTVEEKIYRKQVYKGGLFKSATEHKEQIRYFSQQDLQELFSLPKQGFNVSLTQQQLHEEHDSQHKMDEYLTQHIKFLESQGIAGVSHHSLLFSKTAPVPAALEEEEAVRKKENSYVGKSSSSSSLEHTVDGAEYAFNPKDVKLYRKSTSTDSGGKLTETEIKGRINRLSHIFADKVTVSKLPDKGERIQKQIAELNLELGKIRVAKRTDKEIIDLDKITGAFEKVLNV